MQVQVNTDDHIHGGESLAQWVNDEALSRLSRFRDHITRLGGTVGNQFETVRGLMATVPATATAAMPPCAITGPVTRAAIINVAAIISTFFIITLLCCSIRFATISAACTSSKHPMLTRSEAPR